jgi:CheY-like chemotaxis protein
MNILVAEDDPASSFALRKFLQKAGHNPVCVSNGLEALEALRLYPFHCLFTDVQMPVMEGLEVIRRIRGNAADEVTPSDKTRALVAELVPNSCSEPIPISEHLPVVTISAHAMVGDNERFLEAGTDFYLSKPVDMKELLGVLGKVETLLSMQEKALASTYIGAKQ